MEDLKLSTRTSMLLSKYQDRMVAKKKSELDMLLKKSVQQILADGIYVHDAPFELAGRMMRSGYSYIEYDASQPGWRVRTLHGSYEKYVKARDIENMLELEE